MNMLTRVEDDRVRPPQERQHASRRKGLMIGLPLLVAGAGAVLLANREPEAPAAMPVPTVSVSTPLVRNINEWDDYVGRFEASRSVEVRPRVSGAIIGVHFTDGQIVRQGQLLFTIDPRPFAADLAEAQAGVASARSALALAQTDLGRAQRLIEVEAVSKSDVDTLRARVQAAQAALAAAQARVRARALDVEFSRVRAPITGRISDRRIDPGNLVAGGDAAAATLLTTINALDPIYFTFDGSEALFLKTQRARQGGASSSPVEIRLQDETDYRWKGRLDFTDNGLDPKSGTIRGRAVLSNRELFLTPGMFGNMRLSSGGTVRALLVPDAAVQTDQARKIVYVVDKADTVQAKPVEVGPVVQGLRVIRSGLSDRDRVVISGIQVAAPGARVQVRAGRIAAQAAASEAPPAQAPVTGQATFASN